MTCLSSVGILVCFCSAVVELPHANSWPTVQEQAKSRPLILVSGFIHDVSSFRKEHPGGNWLLESNVGKDATAAFFGGYYAHSSAAHNVSFAYISCWIPTNSRPVVIDDAGWHSRRRRRSRGAPTTTSKEVVYRNTRRLNPVHRFLPFDRQL